MLDCKRIIEDVVKNEKQIIINKPIYTKGSLLWKNYY